VIHSATRFRPVGPKSMNLATVNSQGRMHVQLPMSTNVQVIDAFPPRRRGRARSRARCGPGLIGAPHEERK
jgi:hypothetical protein